MTSALLVRLDEIKHDLAMKTRGERKLVVTEIRDDKEEPAVAIEWGFAAESGKCPVQLMNNMESAVFCEKAKQDKHYHSLGTEIYLLLEGIMTIEVEGVDYRMTPGDMMIVNPGATHEVKREGAFLCRVITANSGGAGDKHNDE
jgi:mannose-6-phosphate isomerase-like protein (cupin superfamily)